MDTEKLSYNDLPVAVGALLKEVRFLKTLLLKKQQPIPAEPQEKLLTVLEAAEFLSLAKPTIYSKVSRGEIPYMKRGKRLYFSLTELTEYIKAGQQMTNAELEQEAELFLSNKKRL